MGKASALRLIPLDGYCFACSTRLRRYSTKPVASIIVQCSKCLQPVTLKPDAA